MDKEIKGEGSQSSVNVSATIVNIKYITEKKGREGERKEEKRNANGERDNRFGKNIKECSVFLTRDETR